MEAIKKDYAPKGVKFYFIYKALAHPEGGTQSYVAPFTLEERVAHIKQAYKELGNSIPWICDNMQNELKHALGDRPNSEFIIDPTGKIVVMRDWSRPESLRNDLEKLVGKVANPTRPSQLKLAAKSTKPKYEKGVVKRPEIPRQLRPVKVIPQDSDQPFYVKLRVEVEANVLNRRSGKLYLGFHLDPIHQVHWNNLASPLQYEIVGLKQGKLTPSKDSFAKVKVESDVDPREFILTASDLSPDVTFSVKVKYFACSDVAGWCKPVTQEYVVELEPDKDAGSARRAGQGRGAGNNPGGAPFARGRFTAERFMAQDKNKDGKITADELPPQMRRMIDRADRNGDQAIDRDEARMMEERMKRRARR